MHFPERWIHGSPEGTIGADPVFQVHALDERTYALRQSKSSNYEGAFLYLLFGSRSAMLLDSGSKPNGGDHLPLRETLEGIFTVRGTPELHLTVAHTHSHGDHLYGDRALAMRPNTTIVPPSLRGIQEAFNITRWPDGIGTFDLGDRRLLVLPTPGHERTHVVFYDEATGALFSGDMLYAGLLVVGDFPAFRASAARLAAFARQHPVSYVLGSHIEMRRAPGELYPIGSTYQPEEHELPLFVRHIEELHEVCEALGEAPREVVRADFIVHPERAG